MEYVPDNYDFYEMEVREQERAHRLYKRLAAEEDAAEREDEDEFI